MNKSQGFWKKIPKPIYALAPMAGAADSAFRQICKSFGAAVVYSEMISATAVVYNSEKTLELMRFDKTERPFVVQLFGAKPEHFAVAAKFITKKIPARRNGGKPDGIDINFGCPVKKVARQGAGAVLMNDLKLARKIIEAVIDNTSLPVSIKIRAKVGEMDALKFLRGIKDLNIAAVMIHGRSLAQGHSGEVDWQIIKQARQYFNGLILANGGVKDKISADELLALSQADGLGIGQGALGRPWIFREVRSKKLEVRSREEIFKIMLAHARLVYKLKGQRGIMEMRKHLCWYAAGLPGAKKLRAELIKARNLKDIKKIIGLFFVFFNAGVLVALL
ncbi:MAG: tRNA-dihydrouridine synthase [bacterium]|nr:tRNA-dihydrouridine synthase [bacterium]